MYFFPICFHLQKMALRCIFLDRITIYLLISWHFTPCIQDILLSVMWKFTPSYNDIPFCPLFSLVISIHEIDFSVFLLCFSTIMVMVDPSDSKGGELYHKVERISSKWATSFLPFHSRNRWYHKNFRKSVGNNSVNKVEIFFMAVCLSA